MFPHDDWIWTDEEIEEMVEEQQRQEDWEAEQIVRDMRLGGWYYE